MPPVDRERKLGQWTRRKKSCNDTPTASVQASDLRDALQQDMDARRQRLFRNDDLVPSEIRRIEAARKVAQCDG